MHSIYSNNLFFYRKTRELTQIQVAKLLNLADTAAISHYERSLVTPSLVRALELAVALNTPVEALYQQVFRDIQNDVLKRRDLISTNHQELKPYKYLR